MLDYNLFLKSAFAYIENRVNSEISMDEVARVAGFSTAHFRDVFREATGRPLVRYIRERRLSYAAAARAPIT